MADEDVLNCKQEYLIIFNGTSVGIFLISFTNVHPPFHFEQQRMREWSIIYTAMQCKWTIFKKDFKNPIFQVQFRLYTYVCNISANKSLELQTIDFNPILYHTFSKWSSTPSSKTLKITSPLFFYLDIGNIYLIPKAILYLVCLLVEMKRKNTARAHVHLLSSKNW